MKIFFILLSLFIISLAQDEYTSQKIDMHGGQSNNYNSRSIHKNNGFQKNMMDMSMFLDKNTSKKYSK